MGPEISLSFSQESTTEFYHYPDEFCPHFHVRFIQDLF